MSNTHLKTAHEYGVQKALEQVGYKSAEEVRKDAEALGLIEAPKTAAANPLDSLFRSLQK
jgi:hypothetical protein